jgi:hypothetical protein
MDRLARLHDAFLATRAGRFAARHTALFGAVIVVLLSLPTLAPLFGGGMIVTGDTMHAVRIFEMHRCLNDGQFPCRWVPDLGNGFGYPLFNYYPPLPYYIGDLLHRLGLSYLRSVDALYAIGLVGAGLSMYTLGRRLWGTLGGIVSATAYVYAPYLALDVYLRGALAELWALAIMPALLWAILELITTVRLRYVPLTALLLAALLLSHNLVAVIFAPALLLWTAVLLVLYGRPLWRPVLLGVAAAGWGFGLAAFFTLPVLVEGDLVQLNSLAFGPFEYTNHFANVRDIFLKRTTDYTYVFTGTGDTPVQIGWFHWVVAALALPAGVLLLKSKHTLGGFAVLIFAVCFTVGVFMATSGSSGIWDAFDALRFLQFPWRYLGLVSLSAAVLAGAWLAVLRDRPVGQQLLPAALFVAVFVGAGQAFFHAAGRYDFSDGDVLSGPTFAQMQRGSIEDYLPRAVEEVPPKTSSVARVVSGDADVSNGRSGSDWLEVDVDARTVTQVRASVYYFEHWRVTVDGQPRPPLISQPHGLIVVAVPPGEHHVDLRLQDTGVRTLGNRLSLAAWLLMLLVVPVWATMRYWRRLLSVLPLPRATRARTPAPALPESEGR